MQTGRKLQERRFGKPCAIWQPSSGMDTIQCRFRAIPAQFMLAARAAKILAHTNFLLLGKSYRKWKVSRHAVYSRFTRILAKRVWRNNFRSGVVDKSLCRRSPAALWGLWLAPSIYTESLSVKSKQLLNKLGQRGRSTLCIQRVNSMDWW